MPDTNDPQCWNRRGFLGLGAVLAGWGWARSASAHNLLPGQHGAPAYDKALSVDSGYRAVFQSANVEASDLLLIQIKNWLNGFQFSYKTRPADLHVISATHGSANLLTYADAVWKRYQLGEKYNVIDPATGAPSVRNVFWPSRFGAGAPADSDDRKGIYNDTGIEALQRRGVLFLT